MWVAVYQFLRLVKWLLWASVVGYSLYFLSDPTPHLGRLGHLATSTEFLMFGLPMAAVIAGIFELMVRDRAYPRLVLDR
jgi:hypothetical protein